MTSWFVTRHPGAREWAESRGLVVDRLVDHLVPDDIGPGDRVIGILPVHLAAEVCRRGGRFLNLSLDVPPALRGRELDADSMRACNARLEEFRVERVLLPKHCKQGDFRDLP